MPTTRPEARGETRLQRPDARLGNRDGGLSAGARPSQRSWRTLGHLGLLLLLLIVSCTLGASYDRAPVAPSVALELGPSERAEEQRRSLRHVFYRNNAVPPPPSARELRRLEHNLAVAPLVEVRELHDLFGNDLELLAYATRDSDRDGVLDYRISEYRGKFFEGDVDLDGDGIRNVYDADPYDKTIGGVDTDGDGRPDKPGSFADRDGDGIPDHLDWSRRKAEPLPDLQERLFHDFDVILVERSARFTPELALAVDDTLRLVFREPMATLRTIAVEDQLLISPDLGDNGLMLGQTQTLTVYTNSIEGAEPIVLLGLLVHEVAHAWQLAQDFDTAELAAENKKMHFPPGHFTDSLERFGWTVDDSTLGEGYYHRLYWPHFYATSPRYLYRGSPPNEWAAWFEDVQRETGSDFLRDSPAVTWGMVGPYSLSSPWEWHADQLMASLYNRLDRAIGEHDNRTYREIATLLRQRMLDTVQGQWSRFDYRNAVGTTIDRELAAGFAISPAELQLLVDRYVIPLADLPMLSEALALSAEPVEIEQLGDSLGHGWSELRAYMGDPLPRKPDLRVLARLGLSPARADLHDDSDIVLAQREHATELDASDVALADAPTTEAESEPPGPGAVPPADDEDAAVAARAHDPIGLPRRHGAGRVGGFAHGDTLGHPSLPGADLSEAPALPEQPPADEAGPVDPLLAVFEWLEAGDTHETEEPPASDASQPPS